MYKKLQKSRSNKFIFGVCGGLEAYTGIGAVFFRIGFLSAVFLFGTGVLVYIILLIAMPSAYKSTSQEMPTINCRHSNKSQCQYIASQGMEYCKGCGAKMIDVVQY